MAKLATLDTRTAARDLAADWRAIEAWDSSIAADSTFHVSTRRNAGRRAEVAARYAAECEAEAARPAMRD